MWTSGLDSHATQETELGGRGTVTQYPGVTQVEMSMCHGSHMGLEQKGEIGPGVPSILVPRTLHLVQETVKVSWAADSLSCYAAPMQLTWFPTGVDSSGPYLGQTSRLRTTHTQKIHLFGLCLFVFNHRDGGKEDKSLLLLVMLFFRPPGRSWSYSLAKRQGSVFRHPVCVFAARWVDRAEPSYPL